MRKQILIFGHDYATHFIDIYNQYTRLFDKNRFEVTVVYFKGKADDTVKQRTLAEHVVFLDASQGERRGMKAATIKEMLRLTKRKQFDLVICHRYKPSFIMLWVAQFQKIPALIFVMHELGTMRSWKRQLLIAALARRNMLFAGVSNAVRDDMRNDLWCVPKERIVTLYNVIDVELTEPQLYSKADARAALHLNPNDFVFGNLARLAKNKDQATLIQAFAKIKSNCPNAKLIILGKGELEPALKQLVAQHRLTNDVIFAGFVAHGLRYMRAFDCFVLSSIQEAFGRVLIEAMLAKLPIIATRVHGIPEVVGDAGFIVESRDVDTMANEMQKVYAFSLQQRIALGEKAYLHVKENYSIPAFEKQFWNLSLTAPLAN